MEHNWVMEFHFSFVIKSRLHLIEKYINPIKIFDMVNFLNYEICAINGNDILSKLRPDIIEMIRPTKYVYLLEHQNCIDEKPAIGSRS